LTQKLFDKTVKVLDDQFKFWKERGITPEGAEGTVTRGQLDQDVHDLMLRYMDNSNVKESFKKFADDLPEGVDPDAAYEAILKIAQDPQTMGIADQLKLGLSYKEGTDLYNLRHAAHNALKETSPEDIDLWFVSGKRPASITKEQAELLDYDTILDRSKAFQNLGEELTDPFWLLTRNEIF
jgi:hypothetical protein